MKRITFIEPVGTMQGSLSKQRKLLYPTHDNSAWDAPDNKRSYATNYRPCYIGNLRTRDGVTYFSTKVRSAVLQSTSQRQVQANLGASVSCKTELLKNLPIFQALQNAFLHSGSPLTFDKWVLAQVRNCLKDFNDFYFVGGNTLAVVANPYLRNHDSSAMMFTPNKLTLVKFWMYCCNTPVVFSVENSQGISYQGYSFASICSSATINVLQLSTYDDIAGKSYIKRGSLFLLDSNGDYVEAATIPLSGQHFTLTPTAPEE